MSVKVMAAVFDELPALPTNRKMVLLKIADHADNLGRNAFPSVARICESCGLAERTVREILRGFRQEGTLEVETEAKGGRGKGQPTVYRIDLLRARELYGPGGEKGAAGAPISGEIGADDDEKGAGDDRNGCKSSAPKPSRTIQEPARAREASAPEGAPRDGAPMNAHWRAKLEDLAGIVGRAQFVAWFGPMVVLEDDGERLRLACSPLARQWVLSNMGGQLRQMQARLGRRLDLVVDHGLPAQALEDERQRVREALGMERA